MSGQRRYTCERCYAELSAGSRGPLPTHCPACRPARNLALRKASIRARGEVVELREEIRALRVQAAGLRRSRTMLQRKAEERRELQRQLDAARTRIARLERTVQGQTEALARASSGSRLIVATAPVALPAPRPSIEGRLVRLRATLGEPGREALGRAIRRVATAAGAQETAERLRDVAAIAEAWAGRIGGPVEGSSDSADARRKREQRAAQAQAGAEAA